jgi:SAM-dependent methyltransferase
MEPKETQDRFASVAGCYDRWVGWEPRLKKELPFLLASLPHGCTVLDVGCGTGAHARALAAAGYRVTGIDFSAAMLEQARAVPDSPVIEWLEGDICQASPLGDRVFDAVLALGNVVPAFGDAAAVRQGVQAMGARTAPGGVLILQYLNSERIRRQGRLVVKALTEPASATAGSLPETAEPQDALWIRHHFESGGRLFFNSYRIRRSGGAWTAEADVHEYIDYPREEIVPRLRDAFASVEAFDGLTGAPFDPEGSDSLGVRAMGRS